MRCSGQSWMDLSGREPITFLLSSIGTGRLWKERIAQGVIDREELGRESQFVDLHFREVLADKAKAEAKEKASEEIDRGREKLKEKARDKLQNLFGR